MIGARNVLLAFLCLGLIGLSLWRLEGARAGLTTEHLTLGYTPVTLWHPPGDAPAPLVVVAHGYGGSRQMMEPMAIALARAGLLAATFDFYGHGRNGEPMRGNLRTIDGVTEALVGQTQALAERLITRGDVAGIGGFVGHSMATDIVIRAARRLGDPGPVVAISMYSEAVTAEEPAKLLIVSGAQEAGLREVALDRVRLVDPGAEEGERVKAGPVVRQALSIPSVGHVGVIYAPASLEAVQSWVIAGAGQGSSAPVPRLGPWIGLLVIALMGLAWPLTRLLPKREAPLSRPDKRTIWIALAAAPLTAILAAAFMPPVFGLNAFGPIAAFFAVWGAVQLAVLFSRGVQIPAPSLLGLFCVLLWSLGLFALALDRYGAAYLPLGPRQEVMALLVVGTIPFCLADGLMARTYGWAARLFARITPVVALFGAMLLTPDLGVAYTVLPVFLMFWLVHGLVGRWIALRTGPTGVALGLGVVLAWSVAASTPLVAVPA
ncbi:MAG: alpha/beta hydrolase [Pseudomonadota bacterium]